MIDKALFLENMERDSDFLKFAISSSLDMLPAGGETTAYLYRKFDRATHYNWDPARYIKINSGEIFNDKANLEEVQTECSTYVHWAFRAGYLTEAAQCAEALKQLDLWEDCSDPD
jgi:hypothetical protein